MPRVNGFKNTLGISLLEAGKSSVVLTSGWWRVMPSVRLRLRRELSRTLTSKPCFGISSLMRPWNKFRVTRHRQY